MQYARLFIFWVGSIGTLFASTLDCIDDPSFFKFLSGHIGNGSPESPFIYLMPCDTMYIAKGVTVKIAPNTYLAFADPKPENAIIVQGNFIVQGTRAHSVTLSSAIDTLMFSHGSLRKPWKGITVDSTGLLVFQNTMVYGAAVPLTLRSKDVNITSSFFYDSHEFAIIGSKNFPLSQNHFIDDFNLQLYLNSLSPTIPETIPETPKKKPEKKSNHWFTYGSVAVITAGGLAYLIFNFLEDENELSPDEKLLQDKPSFPENAQ